MRATRKIEVWESSKSVASASGESSEKDPHSQSKPHWHQYYYMGISRNSHTLLINDAILLLEMAL